MEQTIVDKVLDAGGKLWEKDGMKRIYMSCTQFNKVTIKAGKITPAFYLD